jgi:cytochrome c-type biogenesis protein CcmF
MVSSVHAFAQSSIGTWFAGFLGITAVVCFVFFFLNRDHLRSENKLESLVSRESSFMFNNLLLLGACFAVLCGTLFPMLSEFVRDVKMNLGAPFYNKVMVPIGLLLIFLTAVGPLLAWRNTSVGSIKRNFAIPGTVALAVELVVAGILSKNGVRFWTDMGQMYAMLAFCLSTLVIATVGSEFIRGGIVWKNKLQTNLAFGMYQLTRRNMRRYGGYVVHFGVVLVVIGLAGAAFDRDVEQEMATGDKIEIGRYTLVSKAYTEDDNANYRSRAALLDVYKNGKFLTQLNPEERRFKASGDQPVHIVANHSTLREDLYVVFQGLNNDTGHPIVKAIINPLVNWIWIGVLVIVFGTGMALVPNATVMSVPVPSAVAVASMEKQGMQPAGVGK